MLSNLKLIFQAYDRAVNRGRGANLSQPGPEWYEGFDRMDMTNIGIFKMTFILFSVKISFLELPPDPNCPAEKVLRGDDKSSPDFDSDWQEAKEDVLQTTSSSGSLRKFYPTESLPGPDIGAGVEDEEEEEEVVEQGEEVNILFIICVLSINF